MDGEEDWVNLLVDDDNLFLLGGGDKSSSSSSPLSDIEQHLLFNHDDAMLSLADNDDVVDRFVQDLLLDSPLQTSDQQQPPLLVDDSDDPISKKRKRQLRNKDAALRSRQRKKEYVNDLEMKSRYYEGECRRLGSLLQCVMAENQALRFSLHTGGKAFNVSMTRQESAVLFLESLLLGSLLWLMAIVCRLVVLPQQKQSQTLPVEEKRLPKSPRKQLGNEIRHSQLLMGKPFKASRSRMRQTLHSLQAVNSNILLSVF